jgi:hypothetical protein
LAAFASAETINYHEFSDLRRLSGNFTRSDKSARHKATSAPSFRGIEIASYKLMLLHTDEGKIEEAKHLMQKELQELRP